MDRRALATTTLVMAALMIAAPLAAAQIKVLLLPDSDGPGTDALVAALSAAGCEVTVGPIEYMWNGTNPGTWGVDVVVHLNGMTQGIAPPMTAQQALVDFVRSGGGYVGSQWNGYEASTGFLVDMDDLVLQWWPHPDNCRACEMTWTVVPGEEGHPVLDGIPSPFTFFADGHDAGPLVVFGDFPSQVLMISTNGGPAVTVREFEAGKIVAFSVAANYISESTLQDANIQQLYVNAVAWAAPLNSTPTIEELIAAVIALRDSGAINKGQANGLLSKLESVSRQIDRGKFDTAANQLRAFVNQVEAWIRAGILTPEEGGPLVTKALAIIALLGG